MTMQILYGSLYADAGETASAAIPQIDSLVKKAKGRNGVLIFDVVYEPGEKHDALFLANGIASYTKERYREKLIGFQIAITDDDAIRPMRDIFITQAIDEVDGDRAVVLEHLGWYDN